MTTKRLDTTAEAALERLQPFIGIADSGGRQLSENTGRRFLEALAEKRRAHVLTLDQRDFGIYRLPRKGPFTLLP